MEFKDLTEQEVAERKEETPTAQYVAERTVEVGLGLGALAFFGILFIVPVVLAFYVLYM